MLRPVCKTCKIEMRLEVSGVPVIEHATAIGPYKIWSGDLYRCPSCEIHITTAYGDRPLGQHFERNFPALLNAALTNPDKVEAYEIVPSLVPSPALRYKHNRLVEALDVLCNRWQVESTDPAMPDVTRELLNELARQLRNTLDANLSDPQPVEAA